MKCLCGFGTYCHWSWCLRELWYNFKQENMLKAGSGLMFCYKRISGQAKWTLLPGLAELRVPLKWGAWVTAGHSASPFQWTGMAGAPASVQWEWLPTISVTEIGSVFKSYRILETRGDTGQQIVLNISCNSTFVFGFLFCVLFCFGRVR